MKQILHYEDYETVSDTIYSFGNFTLKFITKLSYNNQGDNRRHYYSECTYNSQKYNKPLTSIQRKINSYLLIENFKFADDGKKEYFMIRYQDMYEVRLKFAIMQSIMSEAYVYNSNNRLELSKVYDPVCIDVNGRHLEMIPVVLNYDSSQSRGVRITLQTCDNYSDITLEQFLGLKYILDNADIYGYTLSVLSYLGRPEFGTNNYNSIKRNNNSPF